jgi:hypothetical protein
MPPRCPHLDHAHMISCTAKWYCAFSLISHGWMMLSRIYAPIISLPAARGRLVTYSLFTRWTRCEIQSSCRREAAAEAMAERKRDPPRSHPRRNIVIINIDDRGDDINAGYRRARSRGQEFTEIRRLCHACTRESDVKLSRFSATS